MVFDRLVIFFYNLMKDNKIKLFLEKKYINFYLFILMYISFLKEYNG